MKYSIPIIISFTISVFLILLLLFGNGIIKIPEIKTEIPSSKIDEILKELESMPVSDLQKLKFEIEKIFKNKGVVLPTY
jgi:hypothetical protein